ncbi:plasmid-partitioning protein [Klebsiella pneumoniae]|nr:plasmid-partitioning protein [Klebsiella pneumoniae]
MLDAAQQLLRMKKQGEKFEPMRIIQALQDFIKTNAKDTQKTEKAYGEGVVAKYNGNYVTLKFDNRKIMKKIEALLESELEKK